MRGLSYVVLAFFAIVSVSSCTTYDEKAIEVAGIYDAAVVNGNYDFDLRISMDGSDNVLIEALFDDYEFEVVRADLDDHGGGLIDFDIHSQSIYNGATIRGDGEYIDGYLQLDYTIRWGGSKVHYRIVAERF